MNMPQGEASIALVPLRDQEPSDPIRQQGLHSMQNLLNEEFRLEIEDLRRLVDRIREERAGDNAMDDEAPPSYASY